VVEEAADDALLLAWTAGDKRAGNALVRRHFSPLYRFVQLRLGEDALDFVQKVFEDAFSSADKVRGKSFRAYVFGIARNRLRMSYRSRSRNPQPVAMTSEPAGDAIPTPGSAMALREEQKLLLKALRLLSEDLQFTVELHYWEGLKAQEIAEILDLSTSAVTSRLHRARDAIATALREMELPQALLESTVGNLEQWARSLRDSLGR
jgi:RNA polymerase sigma-70 factor (ECF subfamily)